MEHDEMVKAMTKDQASTYKGHASNCTMLTPGGTLQCSCDMAASAPMPAGTPLENLFDLEPGSTPLAVPIETTTKVATELVDPTTGEIIERKVDADAAMIAKEERIEDLKIEGQLDSVHTAAMQAFGAQHALSQQVDPKFSARNSEVAAQYLNIALDSIKTRGDLKYKRAKVRIASNSAGTPSSVQNNLIVADRNDVLRSLFNQDFEKTIKGSIKDDIVPEK